MVWWKNNRLLLLGMRISRYGEVLVEADDISVFQYMSLVMRNDGNSACSFPNGGSESFVVFFPRFSSSASSYSFGPLFEGLRVCTERSRVYVVGL